jgi:nitrite reductase/ring-hydroxylating ferredoxin subunit
MKKPLKLICAVDELAEGECREFALTDGDPENKGFLIKSHGRIVAYKNRCPHTGAPLNWQENHFLDICKSHIQCTIHGALFRIHDGHCIWGPCIGGSLKAVDTVVENDRLYLAARIQES